MFIQKIDKYIYLIKSNYRLKEVNPIKILITGGTTFVSKYTAEYFVRKNNMEYIDNNIVNKT